MVNDVLFVPGLMKNVLELNDVFICSWFNEEPCFNALHDRFELCG